MRITITGGLCGCPFLSGELTMPSNEFESTHIHGIRMVPIREVENYGFSV